LPMYAVNWLALAAAGMAALACLYDDDALDPVGLVYLLGLVACAPGPPAFPPTGDASC